MPKLADITEEQLQASQYAGAQIGVLAKIESADSVGHLEEILDAVDGAMVARGDLGAELPVEQARSAWCPMVHSWSSTSRGVTRACLHCIGAVRRPKGALMMYQALLLINDCYMESRMRAALATSKV